MAIDKAPVPELISSMSTVLRSACVLTEKQSSYGYILPYLFVSDLQICDSISVPFHFIFAFLIKTKVTRGNYQLNQKL